MDSYGRPADSNGYVSTPNYETSTYSANDQHEELDPEYYHEHQKQQQEQQIVRPEQVYVRLGGATNKYLDSLGSRWERGGDNQ